MWQSSRADAATDAWTPDATAFAEASQTNSDPCSEAADSTPRAVCAWLAKHHRSPN